MGVRTVLVCAVQVPLVEGGAEDLVRQLVTQLRARGYRSDLVAVPFKWHPKEEIFSHAAAWRLLDLTEVNGERVDSVIATKFPSYCVRHPNKSIWLLHQHRAAYDFCGHPFCADFGWDEMDVAARERLIALDTRDNRRGPARLHHQLGGHRAPRAVQRAVRAAAVPPAAPGPAAAAGPQRRLPALGRAPGDAQAGGPGDPRAGARPARTAAGGGRRGAAARRPRRPRRGAGVSGTACGSPAGWTTRR